MRAAKLQREGKIKESRKYVFGAGATLGLGVLAWLSGSGS